jgi:hypothetical protein
VGVYKNWDAPSLLLLISWHEFFTNFGLLAVNIKILAWIIISNITKNELSITSRKRL